MNDELLQQMAGNIGEIKGLLQGIDVKVTDHIKRDEGVQTELFSRVGKIELAAAKNIGNQQGRASVWSMIWGGIGTAVGAAAALWGSKHL